MSPTATAATCPRPLAAQLTVFEGAGGVYASHIGLIPTAEALAIDDLGVRWMSLDIALKPYPCCHFTHAFVDGAAGVLADLGVDRLDAADVAYIRCPNSPMLVLMVCEPVARKVAPTTIYDALSSVQYVVAARLVGRWIDMATFYDSPLDDPEVLAMAALVTCPPDPDTDFPTHFPGKVIIRLQDGRCSARCGRVMARRRTP